jgi:hypothetical protein
MDHAPQAATTEVSPDKVQAAQGRGGAGFWTGFLVGAIVFGLGGAAATVIVLRALVSH